MKDYTSIYVAPKFRESDGKIEIIGWRFEVVKNGKFVVGGDGYDTPEEARRAGEREVPS